MSSNQPLFLLADYALFKVPPSRVKLFKVDQIKFPPYPLLNRLLSLALHFDGRIHGYWKQIYFKKSNLLALAFVYSRSTVTINYHQLLPTIRCLNYNYALSGSFEWSHSVFCHLVRLQITCTRVTVTPTETCGHECTACQSVQWGNKWPNK